MKLFFCLSSLLVTGIHGAGVGTFFTYFEEGGLGPRRWEFLSMENNQCGGTSGESGFGQSPVTIDARVASTDGQQCDTDKSAYKFFAGSCTWKDLDFSIANNGVKVEIKKGNTCSFGQMNIPHTPNKFNALQFHIHTYSEHQIMGQGENGFFPAELHVVHQEETKESFAVFGTMMSVSANDTAHPVFEYFLRGWEEVATSVAKSCPASSVRRNLATIQKKVKCDAALNQYRYPQSNVTYPTEPINLYDLPTAEKWGTFTYKGGLTTPGCNEVVNWNLLDKPMELSRGQMDRLEYLVLCFVQQQKAADSTIVQSCQYATVASESGSTSRPPQSLAGRQVLHRCDGGPAVKKDDIGVERPPSDKFVKPQPVPEPSNTPEKTKCGSGLHTACSNDKRYNPQASPNLRANAAVWNDLAGYWVGIKRTYDNTGAPMMESFASKRFKHTMPYPLDQVYVFINRTVTGTRFYEQHYEVYKPASKDLFCTYAVPDESANVLGKGFCGVNGYASIVEHFGTSTHEKDGVARLVSASPEGGSGSLVPIDSTTFYYTVTQGNTEASDITSFANGNKTRLTGTGRVYIKSKELPYSEHPIYTTYSYEMHQVDEAMFRKELTEAYVLNDVLVEEQKGFVKSGYCVEPQNCVSEATLQANDPASTETPYPDDSTLKTGWIVFIVIIGLLVLFGMFVWFHRRALNKQADRYKHVFARRVAETIQVDATHDKLHPKDLEDEFNKMDKSGNGFVTKEDLKVFMGERLNARDFDVMFAAIDLDHNGTIEFSEFVAFMAQIGAVYDEEEIKYVGEKKDPIVSEKKVDQEETKVASVKENVVQEVVPTDKENAVEEGLTKPTTE